MRYSVFQLTFLLGLLFILRFGRAEPDPNEGKPPAGGEGGSSGGEAPSGPLIIFYKKDESGNPTADVSYPKIAIGLLILVCAVMAIVAVVGMLKKK